MIERIYLAPIATCLIALFADAGCSAQSNPSPANPWTVVTIRERRSGELPFEEKSNYLWPSPDRNNVPGPDSLVARVLIDRELHPHLEIEDLRTGQLTPMLDASLPYWSPNGKYIACVVWKSNAQPYALTVVEMATRVVVLNPDMGASVGRIKWSPDSRIIASDGAIYGRPRATFYTVSVPEGVVMPLDTLRVLADYEFSWSPDGRWIAFSRATRLDRHGDHAIAADLWIADATSGDKWPILETHDWVELNPLWITDRWIQIDRARWDEGNLGPQQRVVVELSNLKGGLGRGP